jgi:hypothetical protein
VDRNAGEIKREVLADEITHSPSGHQKEWDINGETAVFGVEKI